MGIAEKVENNPVIYAVSCFAAGFAVSAALLWTGFIGILDFKFVRIDDYIKISEVSNSYVELEEYRKANNSIDALQQRNSELEKQIAEKKNPQETPLRVSKPEVTSTKLAKGKSCDEVSGEVERLSGQKDELDDYIDKLMRAGGSMTRLNNAGEQITTYHNDREISEKQRQSDNLNQSLVSLMAVMSSCTR